MSTQLTQHFAVAGQIGPEHLPAIAAQGIRLVINNRPDGEAWGQPRSATLAEAASALGMAYVAIPMGRDGITPDMIAATNAALDSAGGPVLAFCRSGTRSTLLWAAARAAAGEPIQSLIDAAAGAGYDIAGYRPMFEALSAG